MKDPEGSCLGKRVGVSQIYNAGSVFAIHTFQSQVTFD